MKNMHPFEQSFSFALQGIPVRVHLVFFLIAAILGASRGVSIELAIWVTVVFCSVLLHELGHALAMQYYGYAPTIELVGTGGLTSWGDTQRTPSLREQASVSVAGPLAGFLIGGAMWGIFQIGIPLPEGYLALIARDVLWVNLGWGLFNLLPILPLDGGGLMTALLHRFAPHANKNLEHYVSLGVAILLGIAGLFIQWTWLVMIAAYCGIRAFQNLQSETHWSHDTDMSSQIKAFWENVSKNEDPQYVIQQGHILLGEVKTDAYRAWLLEVLVWAYLQSNNAGAALGMLKSFPQGHTPSNYLYGLVLLRVGSVQDAVPYLSNALEDEVAGKILVCLAEAFCELGRYTDATVLFLNHQQCESLTPQHLHKIALKLFHVEQFDDALKLWAGSFERFHRANDAYNIACCLAKKGQPEDALEWLRNAIDAGYCNKTSMDADEDLDSVRLLPGYAELQHLITENC